MINNVLTIAGSDSGGGAGIQADLKTFAALGVYGMSVMTALTAQNTLGVQGIEYVSPNFIGAQLRSVFDDIRVDAVKIGMAGSADAIIVIADLLTHFKPRHIVLDSVMVATSGDRLIDETAIQTMKDRLIPLATLVTPNVAEAEILGDLNVPTLVKGGHKKGQNAVDTLIKTDGSRHSFTAPRVDTVNTHGTGCTLSAAIAANLAKGQGMEDAIQHAKTYLTQAIIQADQLKVGAGHGPVWHGWQGHE